MFIGQDITRVDALDKVLGTAAFAHDLKKNNMLFACVVRSSRPHAVIKRIDVSAARALEGVVTILSHEDIPGENLFGAIKKDQPFLAAGRVRYKGEAILLVVAATEETARRAADLVRIEYEDLENISDPFISIQSPVLIHDGGNLLSHRKVVKGDAAKGFESSDVIVENAYSTTWIDHAYMETEAGLAYLDDRGRVVVASSTQNIHYKMKEISRLLGIPTEEVRVVQATTGGGFGGKLDVTVEGYLALAVWHTKRPVFMRYTREESPSPRKRHPLYIVYKTGAKKDGSLTAVEVNIVGDTGPYNSYGETVCLRAAVHATGPYEVPNVLVNSRMFYTNNPVSGAMRGFGVPQLALAHESQLDEIAGLIGMDPLDIRMKNALKRGSLTATSQALNHSAGLLETLKAVEPFWRERRKEDPAAASAWLHVLRHRQHGDLEPLELLSHPHPRGQGGDALRGLRHRSGVGHGPSADTLRCPRHGRDGHRPRAGRHGHILGRRLHFGEPPDLHIGNGRLQRGTEVEEVPEGTRAL